MLDIKTFNSALEQLETERGIPKDKVIEAIELALAAAYKKDYGKKGQIIRAHFDTSSGKTEFDQIKIVVDESMVRIEEDGEEEAEGEAHAEEIPATPTPAKERKKEGEEEADGEEDEGEEEATEVRVRFNPEHHILIDDAKLIKKDAKLEDEIVFPLEAKDDYGRIAAQTAKQVIIQKIREAEKSSVLDEYGKREGEVITGTVQRIERGNIFVDLGRATGLINYEDQIPGERYRQGERIRAYLYAVEESPRGINLRLSRSHPKFIESLFAIEAPEIANGVVEIKSIAREAGSRSKIAVASTDEHIDPVGSCVGQRGVRVATVISELGGEKIDVIEWAEEPEQFVTDALSPAKVNSVEITEDENGAHAYVEVPYDQLSLAIGKGGQNVRLAAKLTGYKIDIQSQEGESIASTDGDNVEIENTDEEAKDPQEEADTKKEASEETADANEAEEVTPGKEEKEEK